MRITIHTPSAGEGLGMLKQIKLKFKSANNVPVSEARITRKEYLWLMDVVDEFVDLMHCSACEHTDKIALLEDILDG